MAMQTGCGNASSHYLWLDPSNVSPSAEAVILVCALFRCDSRHQTGHAGCWFVTRITGAGAGSPGAEMGPWATSRGGGGGPLRDGSGPLRPAASLGP